MKKIYQGLWILFLALFSLGQLQRFQIRPQLAFYGHDLVLVLYLGLNLVTNYAAWKNSWQKWRSQLKTSAAHRIYLFFSSWVLIGLLVSSLEVGFSLIPFLFIARLLVYGLAIFSFKWHQPFSLKKQKQLWLGVGLLIALGGLLQYFLLPDTRFLRFLGWDDHYYRLIGTLFDPNFTGLILVMTLFLAASLKLKSWLKGGVVLILTPAIALTYSRATYLSLLVAGAALFWLQLKEKRQLSYGLFLVIFLIFFSLPFLPRPGGEGVNLQRTYSITSRTQSSYSALTNLRPYQWLIGRGWFVPFENRVEVKNEPVKADTAHFPDSLFVYSFAATGGVGLILGLLILVNWGQALYKKDVFIFAAFIAVIIHSQVNHSLFQPFVFIYLLSFSQLALESAPNAVKANNEN